jgi:hypothetical protein
MGNLPVQNAAFEHIPPRLAGALSPGSRAAGAEIGDAAFEQVAHRDKAVLAETDAGGIPVARRSPGSNATCDEK